MREMQALFWFPEHQHALCMLTLTLSWRAGSSSHHLRRLRKTFKIWESMAEQSWNRLILCPPILFSVNRKTAKIMFDLFIPFNHVSAIECRTYPELGNQDVSNAAQNCHTVKNVPGIFKIIL